MNKLTKVLALGALLVTAGGTGMAAWADTTTPAAPQAQDSQPGWHGGGMMGHHHGRHGFGFGDPAARLAKLKTELGIRPEQEGAWDAYAKTVQGTAQQMQAAHNGIDRKAVHEMLPQDREAFLAKMHEQRAQAFATVRTAAQTLLPSLDDAQKSKAQNELPGLAVHGHMRHAGIGTPNGSAAPTQQQ